VLLKAIAPARADRYASAEELLSALQGIKQARRPVADLVAGVAGNESGDTSTAEGLAGDGAGLEPNSNPTVAQLLTLYSQSQRSNAGTRGLDAVGEQTYVETALDRDLVPAVLAGEFRLVVISGNAGDGKTAFLQRLEGRARDAGALLETGLEHGLANGCRFELDGRRFLSNYDGSQDEGEHSSDTVLEAFFEPFAGDDAKGDSGDWPADQVRLIAINEGRLVDFLRTHETRFARLSRVIGEGLVSGEPIAGVAVINLNLRSVVVEAEGFDGSILARLIRRMTDARLWQPCRGCDLRDKCYAYHNARTFQDTTAGPRVIERLELLYTLTQLRGRLHITLRDLRSALAFMLVGTRDCAAIHALYQNGERDVIAQSFYFNSWMGGSGANADRLLTLLREVDVGLASDPKLDRSLDFVSPGGDRSLFRFDARGGYDRDVVRRLFEDLPREFSGKPSQEQGHHRADVHQAYVAMARRRAFFERRDGAWQRMLPYRAATRMLALVRGEESPGVVLPELLAAINRGEGLSDPQRLDGALALQVREVPGGTIRSYRLYPRQRFALAVRDEAARARFVEHLPDTLVLSYTAVPVDQGEAGIDAELPINLDVFEMLQRLNDGYRPSIEEEQGYYLSLAVFKNLLGSAPYQEVLLTTTGYEFYRIKRHPDERLEMERLGTTSTPKEVV